MASLSSPQFEGDPGKGDSQFEPGMERRGSDKERRASDRVVPIIQDILSASNVTLLLEGLTKSIERLFDCEAVIIFHLDRFNRQLYAKKFAFEGAEEIRVEITPKSLVGYVAATGKTINIADASSKEELAKYHLDLSADYTWDRKSQVRTRSALVAAIPYQKKLVGVLELLNKKNATAFNDEDMRFARELVGALGHAIVKMEMEDIEEKLRSTSYLIHSASTIDEILTELKTPILHLFDAGLVTIYALDSKTNEIYSKMKSGDTVSEIRLPVSAASIAGYVAVTQKMVAISDVYNQEELKSHHPEIVFDRSWDQKSGFKTKAMLAFPLLHEDKLLGVLQLGNKNSEAGFTPLDERNAKSIADTLALAFFNQQRLSQKKPTKFSYLLENGIISEDELNCAIGKARSVQVDIESLLLGNLHLNRQDIGKSLENFYNVPYCGYSNSVVLKENILTGLNKGYLLKNYWVPISVDESKVVILINYPGFLDKVQTIQLIFPKKRIEFNVGLKADIIDFVNSTVAGDEVAHAGEGKGEQVSALLSALQSEKEDAGAQVSEISSEDDAVSAISESDSTIVRLVNKILTDAYDQGVSDIHIEPGIGKKNMKVRFRKDGACRVYEEIPFLYKQAFISRIKIMARLDIAERRMPQDGKIKMRYGKKEIEYRVATCPTVGGNEDAVLRVLADSKPIPLDNMNFSQRNLALIKTMVNKPYGLVLVVGPTGSGKTTTLHSCLGFINHPERKIWTAEDPVEITQEGLRQVQMQNKIGLDFARAMRSFLRGDPDVIMVGEMRDAETCSIGLEASLTGHLVFSTLHTNSAPETITRLIDMGMNPLNFADALLLILAQRLVRTLCKKCKVDYHPPREEFDVLVREYGAEQFPSLGIEYTDDLMLKKPVGCENCNKTGYAGRTGIHELLEGTETMKRMIMEKSLVEKLRVQAIKDGMTTLKQDGIWKVLKGDTDLKQVLAVCIV